MIKCRYCKEEKEDSCFVYSSRSGYTPYCKQCKKVYISNRRIQVKREAVEYKGGRCSVCGYDKCIRALDFHHIDPKQKDFAIGDFKDLPFEKIRAELDKCILICSNCHKELHCIIDR